jgi:KaiC/GvpD/RAD55 family RecA-like ATPase
VGESVGSQPLLALVSLHHGHHNKSKDFRTADASDTWTVAALDFADLIDHISCGKAFLNCQLDGPRKTESCRASNLIILDVDGDITLEEFWAIPFAQRHCAFTYTSCSHLDDAKQQKRQSPTNHSFRALFPAEAIDIGEPGGTELYAERYHLLLERLGLQLKDTSPAKPAQPWYGNDATQVQLGQAVPLDWEFTADAVDRVRAKAMGRQRLQAAAAASFDDDGLDEQRAVYLLDNLLRPSVDGEFSSYWVQVFNACAASGSDAVRDAFLAWHDRGHHSKTQKGVARRYDKAGSRSGLGKLFALAKEQHGSNWYQLLPVELRRKRSTSTPPITLMSSRSWDDIAPQQDFSSPIPDAVSPAQLQRISFNLNSQALGSSAADAQTREAVDLHNDLLWRIYRLEVELIHQKDGSEEAVDEAEGSALQVEYRNELANLLPLYGRESWRIDQALLDIFKREHNLGGRTKRDIKPQKLSDHILEEAEWLLPDLMMPGRSYMLYGLTGTGKSTMALMLARVITGTPDHAAFLDCNPVPGEIFGTRRVLYVASDGGDGAITDLKTYAKRHKMDQAQWCEDYLRVIGESTCNNATPWKMNLYEMHRLAEILEEAAAEGVPYALVIFDSLKAICPRNVRVGDQIITDYIEILTKICSSRGAASLFIHHQAKDTPTFQGASGIGEMISGIFSIKKKDEQHHFCIEKTRVSLRGNREIPYTIKDGRLVQLNHFEGDDHSTDEGKILAILQEHYERHRSRVAHLDVTDELRNYAGISRDDLRIMLNQRGGNGKRIFTRPGRNDLLKEMELTGAIRELTHKKFKNYAIASAKGFCADTTDQLQMPADTVDIYPGWD